MSGASMDSAKDVYQKLLQGGFSKQEIDSALHKSVLLRSINKSKTGTYPGRNHLDPDVRFFNKINIPNLLVGKALSLLKSQFAKKPKDPV
jgi:hypothetical protein